MSLQLGHGERDVDVRAGHREQGVDGRAGIECSSPPRMTAGIGSVGSMWIPSTAAYDIGPTESSSGVATPTHRREQVLPPCRGPGEAEAQGQADHSAQGRRHVIDRRQPEQRDRGRDLVRQRRRPRGEGVEHPLDRRGAEDHRPAEELGDRHEVELQRGGDPEPALASAHRPEQLGVALGGDPADRPVGPHQLDGADVVGGEPVAAREVAHPAAEGVADHADARRGAGERSQTVRDRGVDDGPPPDPGLGRDHRLAQGPDEPGLAGAGIAGDEERGRLALLGRGDGRSQDGQLLLPTHERCGTGPDHDCMMAPRRAATSAVASRR